MCHVTTWSKKSQMVSTVSHHPVKFGGSMSYRKEDVVFSIQAPVAIPIPILMLTNN